MAVIMSLSGLPSMTCKIKILLLLQLGSHDVARISAKMGQDRAAALNMLLLLLPGTPITYYGEEIAMQNVHVPYEQSVDPAGLNFGPVGCMFVIALSQDDNSWDSG